MENEGTFGLTGVDIENSKKVVSEAGKLKLSRGFETSK